MAERSKEERKILFEQATKTLKDSGIEGKAPKKGESFPDLVLGEKKVSDWLKAGPLIVTFYRGGWCPYCVKQLKQMDQELKKIQDRKATIVAISPEKASEVQRTKSKNELHFTMIADPLNALARQLGLVFKVDKDVASEYKALGIDLVAGQGNENFELPMPATFVIGTDRKIQYAFADADYTKRAAIEDVLGALK